MVEVRRWKWFDDESSIDAFASSPVKHETSDFASLMFVLSAIGMNKNGINLHSLEIS